uniref:Putative secreted protein n=1 Tax=Anopheles darlingi TaxID=43151 RepID=A0A2M4DLS7_ANODA
MPRCIHAIISRLVMATITECVNGCRYLHRNRFLKLAALLNLEHEITSIDVLHDEVETILQSMRGKCEKLVARDNRNTVSRRWGPPSLPYIPSSGSKSEAAPGTVACSRAPARASPPSYTRHRHPG